MDKVITLLSFGYSPESTIPLLLRKNFKREKDSFNGYHTPQVVVTTTATDIKTLLFFIILQHHLPRICRAAPNSIRAQTWAPKDTICHELDCGRRLNDAGGATGWLRLLLSLGMFSTLKHASVLCEVQVHGTVIPTSAEQ